MEKIEKTYTTEDGISCTIKIPKELIEAASKQLQEITLDEGSYTKDSINEFQRKIHLLGDTKYFEEQLEELARFVTKIIQRDFSEQKIAQSPESLFYLVQIAGLVSRNGLKRNIKASLEE